MLFNLSHVRIDLMPGKFASAWGYEKHFAVTDKDAYSRLAPAEPFFRVPKGSVERWLALNKERVVRRP